MDQLKALLLHPEPQVRHGLRELMHDAPGLRVLGEAVSAFEALELLDAVGYGVFFLGLELSDGVSGFELAQMLAGREQAPALVFIAADEASAFTAFELGALDYLLWPASEERFERTLEKLARFRQTFKEAPMPSAWDEERATPGMAAEFATENDKLPPLPEDEEERFISALRQAWDPERRRPEIEKLPINLEGRMLLVPYDKIIFIEAEEDYSFVQTSDQRYLTSYRLKNLEDRLAPHGFFRVHRKYLVNLDMVTEVASLPGSNFMLRTAGRTRIELPVSRRRIAELKQILGL
jgi:DNA-binding LytR/AlgR family response regulator